MDATPSQIADAPVGRSASSRPPYAIPAPRVSTNSEYTDWLAAMNNLFRCVPPKQRLAHTSGNKIIPIRAPSGEKTCTPS